MNTTKPRAELVRAIESYVRLRRGELPLGDELVYLDQQPTIVEVEHGLPFEPDPQHSCSHGSQRGNERPDAADRFAIALLGMAGCLGFALWYVLICGLVAVCQQIGGYLP